MKPSVKLIIISLCSVTVITLIVYYTSKVVQELNTEENQVLSETAKRNLSDEIILDAPINKPTCNKPCGGKRLLDKKNCRCVRIK